MAKYKEWLTDEGLLKIEGWAKDGLTDEQISKNMGIAYSTFREWVKQFSAMSAVLKESKEVVDRQVENALFKRALGYTYEEKEVMVNKQKESTIVKKTVKQIAPDVTAQIFWLKNRKPTEWRDKQEIAHEGNIGITIVDDIGED